MLARLRTLRRDEHGAVVVMVGAILALLLLFAVYAIDASQMLLVKSQLQTAADAGALAGALQMGLGADTTEAIEAAIFWAGENVALQNTGTANTMESVVITGGDVTFPNSGQIRVTTHRTDGTDDSFLNYFLRIFDDNGEVGEMTARATATFLWVCGTDCLRPWAVPDRWFDADSNGLFNSGGGDTYDPVGTGYGDGDVGTPITIVNPAGQGNNAAPLSPEYYNAVRFPPANKLEQGNPEGGTQVYLDRIAGCRPEDQVYPVEPGDLLRIEPGSAAGNPQAIGTVNDLIAMDPNAAWDPQTNQIVNSAFPTSPRAIKMAFIDPEYGVVNDPGGQTVQVVKIAVLFITNAQRVQNEARITGIFMRLADSDGIACDDQSNPSFLFKTSLIE